MRPSSSFAFSRLLSQWAVCFYSFCYFFAFLFIQRFVFLLVFKAYLKQATSFSDISLCLIHGAAYDCMVSAYAIGLPFSIAFIGHFFKRTTSWFNSALFLTLLSFFVVTSFLFVIDVGFFQEYHDHLNHFFFELFYDDTKAILNTVWKQYHPLINLLFVTLWVIAGLYFFNKGKRRVLSRLQGQKEKRERDYSRIKQTLYCIAAFLALFAVMRGFSLSGRPMQKRDAAIHADSFLNKATLNASISFKYLLSEYWTQQKTSKNKNKVSPKRVQKALSLCFPHSSPSHQTIDAFLQRQAKGTLHAPRHIFLFFVESLDSWPLLSNYRSLHLCPELFQLTQKGLWIPRFLSASAGTMSSLSALLTGTPDVGIHTNYQKRSFSPYTTSLATTLKKLGYQTRFFYGGHLSWCNVESFAQTQGFDSIHGAGEMTSWQNSASWGCPDKELFRFLVDQVKEDVQPSFHFILTTSYHPPYDIDVYSEGFPLREIPQELASIYSGNVPLSTFGHLWYSDHYLGQCIKQLEKRFPDALFVITGDHFSRKFLHAQPHLFESSSVPLILYGPQVLQQQHVPPYAAGDHLDILPTLVELSAPKGFTYYTMGKNLLDHHQQQAIGRHKDVVIGPHFIANQHAVIPLPGEINANPSAPLPSLKSLWEKQRAFYDIGWWRIINGEQLD